MFPLEKAVYSCYKLTDAETAKLKALFPVVHSNEYYSHCTIAFGPEHSILPFIPHYLYAVGRLTTDKVDVLLVGHEDYEGLILYPHITLSTAEGVPPVASNGSIEKYYDLITWFNTPIQVETYTYNKTAYLFKVELFGDQVMARKCTEHSLKTTKYICTTVWKPFLTTTKMVTTFVYAPGIQEAKEFGQKAFDAAWADRTYKAELALMPTMLSPEEFKDRLETAY